MNEVIDLEDAIGRLEQMAAVFERLKYQAGYAAFLHQESTKLEVIAIALENQHTEGDNLMAVGAALRQGAVLRQTAADVKQAATDVETSIQAAITRLSDNPTAADITAALADLGEASTVTTTAATIDPDDTSGGVVDDGSGGGRGRLIS